MNLKIFNIAYASTDLLKQYWYKAKQKNVSHAERNIWGNQRNASEFAAKQFFFPQKQI
mgnify:CR=1 FL=1